MSYAVAFMILVAAAAAAALAALAGQRVDLDLRRRHHDVGSAVFLQLGTLFAVFLAFVFSQVWSEYNETQRAIDQEVSAMHGAAIIAATLPAPENAAVLAAELAYLEAVVAREWPAMAARRAEDRDTERKLVALTQRVAALRPSDPDIRDAKSEIMALLAAAHVHRETRIYEAGAGIPPPLWGVLIVFTAMLTLFLALSQIAYRWSAVGLAACFAAALVSILVVARLLEYPFEGALALEPGDFAKVAAKVAEMLKAAQ